jgi:hypothetical protein
MRQTVPSSLSSYAPSGSLCAGSMHWFRYAMEPVGLHRRQRRCCHLTNYPSTKEGRSWPGAGYLGKLCRCICERIWIVIVCAWRVAVRVWRVAVRVWRVAEALLRVLRSLRIPRPRLALASLQVPRSLRIPRPRLALASLRVPRSLRILRPRLAP